MRTKIYRKEFREKQEKKRRLRKLFLLLTIVCISIFSVHHVLAAKHEVTVLGSTTERTISPTPEVKSSETSDTSNSQGISDAVENALTGTEGTYGVYVKNIKTGEIFTKNAHSSFESGSLYKLWVMATVYQLIEENTLHENDTLSENVKTLNKTFNLDPDSAEKTDGTITLSVHDALSQMITVSDNYAALLLTETVGLTRMEAFLKTNNFNESKLGTNTAEPSTTAYDMGLFFEKLYKGQLANDMYTDEMVSLLKQQKLNEKIPEYLPTNVTVAHKTGELDSFSHDAGIIYGPSGDYILVVLSESDPDSRDLANERIAHISQGVYNYFN